MRKQKRTRRPQEVVVRCVGRKEPSKEALDRFIEIYVRMVKENESKQKEVNTNAKTTQRV
ncbi:hypothetical protein GYMC52_2960 [Geobacillus sp. Y412MC52]|nr:hypothetical protein GYMC52_2960 [Geobacillus sp. Y412MC52]